MTQVFAVCPAPGCENWEVPVFSQEEKERRQEAHKAKRHPATVTTVEVVTALVADDPMGQRERVAIEEAIRVAARLHGGKVSANDVRPLLPPWVLPQRIGAVFVAMKTSGQLESVGRVPSTDSDGRNTHHDHNSYLLREAS